MSFSLAEVVTDARSVARSRLPAAVAERRDADAVAASWRRAFERLATGEIAALDELYELASACLFGLALWRTGDPADAEEVVQEVFVRLAEQRLNLAQVRDPVIWLLTLAHRLAIDLTRRRAVRASEPLAACEFLAAPASDPARQLDAQRASSLLSRLPATQREAVYLRQFAGLSFAAIGRIVGVSLFTAASRHRLGLARLRKLLEEGT